MKSSLERDFGKKKKNGTTSFKREFGSHWLIEHSWFVCLDSELGKTSRSINQDVHRRRKKKHFYFTSKIGVQVSEVIFSSCQPLNQERVKPYSWS